jgi:regulator of replication initiation timing
MADPAVKELRGRIAEQNRRIAAVSAQTGEKLPDTHPLLLERKDLFRRLKEAKNEKGDPEGPKGSSESAPTH